MFCLDRVNSIQLLLKPLGMLFFFLELLSFQSAPILHPQDSLQLLLTRFDLLLMWQLERRFLGSLQMLLQLSLQFRHFELELFLGPLLLPFASSQRCLVTICPEARCKVVLLPIFAQKDEPAAS